MGVSHLCLAWPGLWSSFLCFPHNWNDRQAPPCPVGWERVLWSYAWSGFEPKSCSTSGLARIWGMSLCA
jgi:hypothetical protein